MFTFFYTKNLRTLILTFIYLFLLSVAVNQNTSINMHKDKFDASTREFVKPFRNITPEYIYNNNTKDMNPFIGLGILKNLLHDKDGFIGGHGRRVHNLFLNHYSEVGIFGLISLLLIYLQLFFNYKTYNDKGKILVIIFFIFGIISTLQPVYLFSQVSTCLVPWLVYGLLLGKILKKR